MIKKISTHCQPTITLTPILKTDRGETSRELTCYNKWRKDFDERGAEVVGRIDGMDVIISSRTVQPNCWSGKAK